jgi:hypothetical protein
MKIQEISKETFENIDCARQIIYHDHSRRFASLEIDDTHGKYGLAWYSDLIWPVIIDEPKDLLIWIGVDQQLVGINKSRGNIVVSWHLFYIFVDMLEHNSMLFALTELELIVFNSSGSLSQIKDLPEISLGLSVCNDMLSIDLIDGETLNINLKDL